MCGLKWKEAKLSRKKKKGLLIASLRKQPFLFAPRCRGRFARRTQRQKFHTDDVNPCLNNKSGSHGVQNANLFNFTLLLVDFGEVL